MTREKPLLVTRKAMPRPVFAFGKSGSGLTALAMALSMLGYRCCSDITALPTNEHVALLSKGRSRVFDAYVNVGSLEPHVLIKLARIFRQARFIMTAEIEEQITERKAGPRDGAHVHEALLAEDDWSANSSMQLTGAIPGNVLILPVQHRDKWELLCGFLGCDYPSYAYPECEDLAQRLLMVGLNESTNALWPRVKQLKGDSSPWDCTPEEGMARFSTRRRR